MLLRVAMANQGPLPQAALLAVYHRLIVATRRLELAERKQARQPAGEANGPVPTRRPPAPGQ